MSWMYLEINGTKVLRKIFNDTKTEQEFMARFSKEPQEGFVTVHKWQPGHQSTNRAEIRYISALDFFVAPIVDGKVQMDLGSENPEPAVPVAESLEIPEDIKGMNDKRLLEIAPMVNAKVNPRMPRKNLLAAVAVAIKKNPKNWESVRAQFAANELKRSQLKAVTA